ncbi:MAG: hypothetical protein DRH17_09050 [Deltaproteobacteria bacterium]|nr:MAG: hypothetical protein DRH17_09050 [Deltaproteobacteria bacterium]
MTERGTPMDIHIIAERVAEVVNKKLAVLDRRITELESKVKKLELDVYTVRSQTIESIVRSVLGVKTDDIASAIVAKLGSELAAALGSLSNAIENLESVTSDIKKAVDELEALKELPEKIVEAVGKVRLTADVDTTKIEAAISTTVSKSMKTVEELSKRVAALEKKLDELNQSFSSVSQSLAALSSVAARVEDLKKSVDDLKESVDYVRDVSSILEERLKGRPSEEEEEEEES